MKNFLSMRAISQELTGSPHKIRTDFVPAKYKEIISVCKGVVEKLINDFKKEAE